MGIGVASGVMGSTADTAALGTLMVIALMVVGAYSYVGWQEAGQLATAFARLPSRWLRSIRARRVRGAGAATGRTRRQRMAAWMTTGAIVPFTAGASAVDGSDVDAGSDRGGG